MSQRVVNCFRGTKLIGSYVIDLPVAVRQVRSENEFVEAAKAELISDKLAAEPFSDFNFVVRERYPTV
jgi:hypothetical protein